MKILVYIFALSCSLISIAFADEREIYHNQVSDHWNVIGTYDDAKRTKPQRVQPLCVAQLELDGKKDGLAIIMNLAARMSYIILASETWHSTKASQGNNGGPYPAFLYFEDRDNNISDSSGGREPFVWGHGKYYYTVYHPKGIMINYPQSDIIVHAIAANDKLRVVPQDNELPPIEFSIEHPGALPAAWAECINNFSQLVQEDQAKESGAAH